MRVPSEIVRLIVEEIEDSRSLVALSQGSKELQVEAERLLYRFLTENDGSRSFRCLSSIKKCPRRGEFVRVYHVHITAHKQRRSIWNLIGKTLPLMVNLRELVFRYIIGAAPHTTIIPRDYTPRLQKFAWSGGGSCCCFQDEYHEHTSQALKFLERQTHLQHLYWQPSSAVEPIANPVPPTFAPHLDTLIGDIETIRTYLPGRDSITTLQLFTGKETRCLAPDLSLEETFESLSPQLRRLKYLSIQPWIQPPLIDTSLQLITPHLHSLETLRVLSLTDLEIYQELPKLKNLKRLIIIHSLLPNQPLEEVKLIFACVPSLIFLYTGQEDIYGRDCESKYKRWTRRGMASTEAVLTHITEVHSKKSKGCWHDAIYRVF
ncbi:hypothetical protein M413DRAFT_443025 [Hebeloma cylindrosporum]|uniref:F-box domain-containing protein n=1 Tax=Hebeloma cylindrosporum TaxID=76867 RepID=A0A0C2YSD6_HEBCY|nr:hypothetical protein M413DRAFT_443025 [Hebeloma cylindrosporum h7]